MEELQLAKIAEQVAELVLSRVGTIVPPKYLSARQAAQYLGISEDSVRNLLSSGRLTGLRPVPGRVVIDRVELDSLARTSTKGPKAGRGRRRA